MHMTKSTRSSLIE